ncbi:MAG: bifunctional metallophosphatase/5'-nucleotidase [Melioribacteraceae bacterium]|nr:bifunctional metallophosphatase/5'-nucleotidase [Melioribacteraceae bacterium]
MKKLQLSLILLLLFSSIFSQNLKIKIIETTDVHGAIYPFDFKNERPAKGSLSQVSSMLKIERANKNQEVVLLDNGDFLQGTPAVYYYNFEKPDEKHLYAEVMNYMKYDAGSVGNHDIETGHGVYDKFKKEINFPWLSANAADLKNGGTYFEPYSIVERSGVKIAILGLTTPGIPNWLPPKIFEGIDFEDMIKSAEMWIPIIKEKENPDIIVGLFHSGVDFTYGGYKADSHRNENAAELIAKRVAGFDLIFVGHDHHGWNKSVKNPNGKDVLILGATSRARNVAVANLIFDKDKNKLVSVEGELVEMSNYKPDEEFQLKFEPQFDEIKKYVSQPLGKFKSSLELSGALFGPSKFTELINNIQTELTNADISFTAPLSFNGKIDSGTIYVRDMFKLYRYENLLYTIEMSGYEIKNYLEYVSELWFNKMVDDEEHLIKFKKDKGGKIIFSERTGLPAFANSFYNFDACYGINYTIDITKPVGEKVTIFNLSNGDNFYFDKKYKVAVNSYRGNGGGGHLVKGAKIPKEELAKRIISSTEKDLRFYIMKWIEKEKEVEINSSFNWKVIPEDLWLEGKERDYKLLFN